jgi:hypothetical protein
MLKGFIGMERTLSLCIPTLMWQYLIIVTEAYFSIVAEAYFLDA